MDPLTPAHMALKLCRDISMGRRVPAGWKRPRGRPRTTWSDQMRKDTGKPVSTLWTRAQDRRLWARDATALRGYARCGEGDLYNSLYVYMMSLYDESVPTGMSL